MIGVLETRKFFFSQTQRAGQWLEWSSGRPQTW